MKGVPLGKIDFLGQMRIKADRQHDLACLLRSRLAWGADEPSDFLPPGSDEAMTSGHYIVEFDPVKKRIQTIPTLMPPRGP